MLADVGVKFERADDKMKDIKLLKNIVNTE